MINQKKQHHKLNNLRIKKIAETGKQKRREFDELTKVEFK